MKQTLLILLFLLTGYLAIAQGTVSGTVSDLSGEPLPGVNIMKVGTSDGVVTDLDGNYTIQASADDVLRFSFIGFSSQNITVGEKSVINVRLEEDISSLTEVVVVGYGSQKKSVASAAISSADVESMEKLSIPNVGRSLQGLVNGVTVSGVSGQPGSNPTILIRGVGSNSNNRPLVVIDGLQTQVENLNALSPNDIESIQVLKDAASTAIYGTRGANGVIVVKTKSGKPGQMQLDYNGSYFIQSAWKKPQMLNAEQYVDIINEKYANGNTNLPLGFPEIGTTPAVDTDWMDRLFTDGTIQNHNLSVSKGTENGHIFASLSYTGQDGIVAPEKSYFDRITVRLNSETRITDFITFGQNLSVTATRASSIPENNEFGTPIADAIVYDPLTPVFDNNAQFGFAQSPYVQKEYVNPFSRIFLSNRETNSDQIFGNAFLEFQPISWLKFRTDLGVNRYNEIIDNYSPAYQLTPAFMNDNSSVSNQSYSNFRWQWENYVTATKDFGLHNIEAVLGSTAIRFTEKSFGASGQNLPVEAVENKNLRYVNLTPDSSRRSYGGASAPRINSSIFFRTLYNYDEKYLATVSFRRDGSSNFGSEYRFAIFPSFSAGWVASEESFFNVPLVDFAKLRVSYGSNGSDNIGAFNYTSLVIFNSTYQFGDATNQTIYYGATPASLSNPFVRWEESKQLDIGLETKLFDNQVSFELDYYKKVTDGLLIVNGATPIIGGNNPAFTNVGQIENSGFEFKIDYYKQVGELGLGATLNGSTLNNIVTRVDGNNGFLNGYNWPVRNAFISRMEVGEPLFYFRGYQADGIFRDESEVFSHINREGDLLQPNAKPGDLRYVDVNDDGEINLDDWTNIGKPWADFTFGLNLTANYKAFDFNMLIVGQTGNQIYRTFERQDVVNNNYTIEWLDRWSETNPDGSYPRVVTGAVDPVANNNSPSSFFVEDGDFVRIKNLQIGYSVPQSILEKAKIKKARIYLSVDNLLTLTGYSGFDPEIGVSNYNVAAAGIDRGYYPQTRNYGGGIQVSF
ncbi:TonB-dependent receptor [Marivirga sp. S37H4]|uniref:TonB-dependent receptor n=1 Tax=Marivirga aurantiaca TaxID=2802615 RepID=A0A935C9J7_9BACT|nr:TonB-dependent receptor [Marivirga aurantiaca]MBK6264298.1 TonB-dependent receptor [Marivirga aurantiaca]